MVISNVTQNSADLEWKPSKNDGGTPITAYVIEIRAVTRTTWSKAGTVDSKTTSFTAKDLLEGTEYFFRVIAVNLEGNSSPLDADGVTKPMRELSKLIKFFSNNITHELFVLKYYKHK